MTLIPALLAIFTRGRILPEARHPMSRRLVRLYAPALAVALRYRKALVGVSVLLILSIAWPFARMGTEFMPPLYEGTILYMPTTLPGISVTEAGKLLQQMDKKLKAFPEVKRVFPAGPRLLLILLRSA